MFVFWSGLICCLYSRQVGFFSVFLAEFGTVKCPTMERFVLQCELLGLPLNAGKAIMHAFQATILGGEFDGVEGSVKHGVSKGEAFVMRVATVVASNVVSQVMLQNVAGHFCFLASFRRPLFCVMQEIFGDICAFSDNPKQVMKLSAAVSDELVIAALLAPLAGSNLRAPLRVGMSISDASEEGAGAAVSSSFVKQLSSAYAAFDDLAVDSALLSSADGSVMHGLVCSGCNGVLGSRRLLCHSKCSYVACSVNCWARHEADLCTYRRHIRSVVWVVGSGPASQLALALARNNFFPKFTEVAEGMPAELDDAEYLHSVDFLCATPVSRKLRGCKLVYRLADACYDQAINGKFFVLSFRIQVLKHPALCKLLALDTVRCSKFKLYRDFTEGSQGCIISNLKGFNPTVSHASDGFGWTSWPFDVVSSLVSAFANESLDLFSKSLPSGSERQWLWVKRALLSSTKGLARAGIATAAADSVFRIIETARDVSIEEHLKELYQLVDHRGSDVRLDAGEVLDSAAQAVPYPAPIWDWRTVPLVGLSGYSVSRFVWSWCWSVAWRGLLVWLVCCGWGYPPGSVLLVGLFSTHKCPRAFCGFQLFTLCDKGPGLAPDAAIPHRG